MQLEVFQSFEEYAVALQHADLRLIALGRERARWRMGRCTLDGVQVRLANDGGPSLMDVAIGEEGVGFAMGLDAAGQITGNGVVLGAESVMVIPHRTEVRSATLDAISWCSAFIPLSHLPDDGSGNGRRRLSFQVVEATTPECSAFRQTLCQIVSAAVAGAFAASPLARRDASRRLVDTARPLLESPGASPKRQPQQPGRPRISRTQIIGRVHEWIDNQGTDPATLDDLTAATGVSVRTLHNAFHEQFGVSPKRFLRLRQLNAARSALRRADPATTRVADVMATLGVWEWGRFSGEYHALFGELPSQTLQMRARRVCISRSG